MTFKSYSNFNLALVCKYCDIAWGIEYPIEIMNNPPKTYLNIFYIVYLPKELARFKGDLIQLSPFLQFYLKLEKY